MSALYPEPCIEVDSKDYINSISEKYGLQPQDYLFVQNSDLVIDNVRHVGVGIHDISFELFSTSLKMKLDWIFSNGFIVGRDHTTPVEPMLIDLCKDTVHWIPVARIPDQRDYSFITAEEIIGFLRIRHSISIINQVQSIPFRVKQAVIHEVAPSDNFPLLQPNIVASGEILPEITIRPGDGVSLRIFGQYGEVEFINGTIFDFTLEYDEVGRVSSEQVNKLIIGGVILWGSIVAASIFRKS